MKILCEYSSSKKLLDSDLESSTRVTRVTRHSPTPQVCIRPIQPCRLVHPIALHISDLSQFRQLEPITLSFYTC